MSLNPLDLYKHLLPRARAWSLTANKRLREFFGGLVAYVTDARDFMDLVWLDGFPQSTRVLEEWESQFALTPAGSWTEQERRDRLEAAWSATGGQSPRYIQDTLQGAGFPVFIHEWWVPASSPAVARDPLVYLRRSSTTDLDGGPLGYPLVNLVLASRKLFDAACGEPAAECGEFFAECGNFQAFALLRREYLIPEASPQFWPYFLYIGAETFPNLAQIPLARKLEFERMCLKLCPTQQWLGMLVEYV